MSRAAALYSCIMRDCLDGLSMQMMSEGILTGRWQCLCSTALIPEPTTKCPGRVKLSGTFYSVGKKNHITAPYSLVSCAKYRVTCHKCKKAKNRMPTQLSISLPSDIHTQLSSLNLLRRSSQADVRVNSILKTLKAKFVT